MNRTAYRRLARTLMDQHGLTGWRIEWNRAKRTHGSCCYGTMTLTFSEVAFDHVDEDEIRDTITHEIAHALAGSTAGHGPRWVAIHRSIGGTGARYVSKKASQAIPMAWEGTCPQCGKVFTQHRAPLRVKACSGHGGRFAPETILSWKQHGRRVPLGAMPVRYVTEARRIRDRYQDRAVSLR